MKIIKLYKVIFLSIFYLFINNQTFAQEDTTRLSESFEELLNLSLKELMEVDITTASKKTQKLSEAPSIISAVTKQDIEKMGVTSLIDVLKYIPGIETSMGVNGAYRVSIRGERKDGNILVLMDGKPINNFYNGNAIYDFPVDFIERIEVIRGPGSAIYGTNAVAGVINIIPNKKDISLKINEGTNKTYSSNLNYNLNKNNLKLTLNGGYFQTDGANVNPSSSEETTLSENNETNHWLQDAYLNTNLEYKNFNFSLFGLIRKQGSWVGPSYVLAPNSDFNTNQIVNKISYVFNVSDKLNITPIIYANVIFHDYLIQEQPDGYIGNPSQDIFIDGKFTEEKYTAVNPGYELNIDYTFNESFDIVTGILYEIQSLSNYSVQRNYKIIGDEYIGTFGNYDNVSFDQEDKKREIFAYYLEGNYKFTNLILITGIRYDSYSDFGESFNPRLGIVYKPFNNFSIKALYGEAFRAPTLKELYDKTNIGADGVLGNINLYPEKISTSELGIEFDQPKYIIRANAFYNFNNDIIQIYDPEGGGAAASYENIGNIESVGYEIEVISTINKNISVFANFSQFNRKFEWSDEDVISDDIRTYLDEKGYKCIRNSPTIRLNAGVDFVFSKFHFFAGINYGGESMNNDRQAIEGLRLVNIDPYLLGNFKIEYLLNRNFKLKFSGNNIGETKYSDPDESTNIHRLGRYGMAQPGNTFILSATYNFKK